MLLSRVLLVLILFIESSSYTGLASKLGSRASIKWEKSEHSSSILIRILGLNNKQTTTLDSGFSTFSQLRIFNSHVVLSPDAQSLAQTACTVKYDMWEEHYEVTLLTEPPKAMIAKTLDTYLTHCLSAKINSDELVDELRKNGGTLLATLQVEQISSTQAQKVKAWLINQQSSVMRGLFSHMLGEMTLTQTSKISLQVPPPPTNP
ncbi:MAG: hypothetical protein AB8G05_26090 [Oligoflexales bacterium]